MTRAILAALLLATPAYAGASFWHPSNYSFQHPSNYMATDPTPAQVSACTEDAFRLCGAAMPDREAVKICMVKKRHQLSAACREAIR